MTTCFINIFIKKNILARIRRAVYIQPYDNIFYQLINKKTDLHKLDERYVRVYDNMSIICVIKCHSSSAALASGQYNENTWSANSKSSSDGGNKALTII